MTRIEEIIDKWLTDARVSDKIYAITAIEEAVREAARVGNEVDVCAEHHILAHFGLKPEERT